MTPTILNSKGEPVRLTNEEKHHVSYVARQLYEQRGSKCFRNALGYEVAITTLTTIIKRVSEQKFFQVAPADYLPVRVGEGTWSSNLLTYRSFDMADDFESGIINTGGQNSRLSTPDAGVDSLTIQVFNWAKAIGWSIFDIELAAKSGNWDLVSAKEKSRKKNWDLGIQRVAFLGANGQNGASGNCLGLLNQGGITVNSSLIAKPISTMTYTELAALQQGIIQAYRANCNYTAFPSHFIIPESDYNGLVVQSSPQFPLKSMLQLLEEGFQVITGNKKFRILPLAYADVANSSGVLTKQTYTLLNYDEESLRMDVPLDYTNTLANSIDNFNFQNVGYGQFTGVLAYRPLEMLYLSYTP
jgi:hypothetical protein